MVSESDKFPKKVTMAGLSPLENSQKLKRQLSHQAKQLRPDQPIHKITDSLLSTASGFSDYRGLLNLSLILLVLSNARVALENILKYGILVDPLAWYYIVTENPKGYPCTQLMIVSNLFILLIFFNERFIAEGQLSKTVGYVLQWAILISMMIISATVILVTHPFPILSIFVMSSYTVLFFKLASYVMVNRWCRDTVLAKAMAELERDKAKLRRPSSFGKRKSHKSLCYDNEVMSHEEDASLTVLPENDDDTVSMHSGGSAPSPNVGQGKKARKERKLADQLSNVKSTPDLGQILMQSDGAFTGHKDDNLVKYPKNLTLVDMYYFMFAPTLCYELNFPRTKVIRKRFAIKRFIEMIVLTQVMLALIQQWMIPLARNSVQPFKDMRIMKIVERIFKLAIPNHIVWLMMFYTMFHSGMNFTAEMLRFGDREFYRDWWNAQTVSKFWQLWNIPVHRWAVRHVYKPLRRVGFSSLRSSIVVFAISAVFHELIVSVPLRMFRVWAFLAMLGQVPLAYLGNFRAFQGQFGNIIVWLSLILGQPLAIIMYFHDYYVMYMEPQGAALPGNQTVSSFG